MSLRRLVVEKICERGCGTVDHLAPDLLELGYTRPQVIKALQNASSMGFLWCEKVRKPGRGRSSAKPSIYWPGRREVDPMYSQLIEKRKEPPKPMFAFVFNLANPLYELPQLRTVGTIHSPLGGWNSEGA